jgi:ketosteroid isomerase-like protein
VSAAERGDAAAERRAANRALLHEMLRRLGAQEWAAACALLSDDVHCDWPYRPVPEMPFEMRGRETLRAFFQRGMSDFAPYRYQVTQVYELLDPDSLIAEYRSDSRLLATGAPYRNAYLGIFRFRAGQICYWREYINPQVVAEVLATRASAP